MGDWQELGQTVVVGLIFSYLVAKLISTVISFREDHLKVVRETDLVDGPLEEERGSEEANESAEIRSSSSADGDISRVADDGSVNLVAEGSLLGEDDDDWEGIESTELDEMFSAATAFVAATAADRASSKVSNDIQLQLYGLYKVATEGPCTAPQPSALKVTARAKWNVWKKLGAMPPEDAMEKYIEIVDELFPSWSSGSNTKNKREDASSSSATGGTMGPVFSSLILEEGSENDLSLDAIHISAREGEVDGLLKNIDNGVSVNLRDSEGRSPLHWAVDRGHLKIVEILLRRSADVNAKDNDGQTPLHYAAVCEREAFAKLLVEHGADPETKDDEGKSPIDLWSIPWNSFSLSKQ